MLKGTRSAKKVLKATTKTTKNLEKYKSANPFHSDNEVKEYTLVKYKYVSNV